MINNYFSDDQYHSSDHIYRHPTYNNSLHIGDMSSALDIDFMHKCNIKTVITAAAGMEHIEFQPDSGIKHIVYPLLDIKSENIGKFFNPGYQLLESQLAEGSVLVHCAAGISRSATLVIAYLMKHKSWTFKDTIAFVRESRPKVCPNLGFQRQLKEYQHFLVKKQSQSIQRKGPRTSQEPKHNGAKKKIIGLPEIGVLGRTHVKSIVLNPFTQKVPSRASYRGMNGQIDKKEDDEFPYRLKPLKVVRKTKSLMQKSQQRQNKERPVASIPLGNHSQFLKKVNIGQSHTERLIRRRPIIRFQKLNNPL